MKYLHKILSEGDYVIEIHAIFPFEASVDSISGRTYLVGYAILSNHENKKILILSTYNPLIFVHVGIPISALCKVKKIPILPRWFVFLKLCAVILIPFLITYLVGFSSRLSSKVRRFYLVVITLVLMIYVYALFQNPLRVLYNYVTYSPERYMVIRLKRSSIVFGFTISIQVRGVSRVKLKIPQDILDLMSIFLKYTKRDYIFLYVAPPGKVMGPVERINYFYKVRIDNLEKVYLFITSEVDYVEVFVGLEVQISYMLKS